jgi:hypothetical protein
VRDTRSPSMPRSHSHRYAPALLLLTTALSWNGSAWATTRPAVVELYTSEGCSSCPLADALLGEIAGQPGVLALAFHVDYWDTLGWSDKFALPYAAQRQLRYAQGFRLPSVFTPQVVIDGTISVTGSDRAAIITAIRTPRDGIPIAFSGQGHDLTIELGHAKASTTADVLLVAYLPQAVTAIGRGENSGRTLREFNIVRATYALGKWNGDAQTFSVPSSSLPKDATAVAVLIQESNQRVILGAATTRLR